jgi:NAD(P)-dependent dehydrogenase (short-subunit alcohol dehydrogenase family)
MSGVEFKPKTSSKVDFSKAFDASVLNGCSVLITGGASGLGACFASDLASKGCFVTIVDTNEELAESSITEHEANGLK